MMRPVLLSLLAVAALQAANPPARFREHVLATGLKGGYQVVVADLNHDGKPDIIALASGLHDLLWFENPGWERHVLASGLNHMINLAAWDTDGDGIPEVALADEFANQAKNSLGFVSLLRHHGYPTQPWSVTQIDRLPTSHRLRWADIDGSGHKVLIDAPLTGADAIAPEYRDHVPLVYYRPGEWKRHLIARDNEGVQHGIYIVDWDGHGRDAILTASFSGIALYRYGTNGQWTHTEIAKGDPSPWPKCGSSDIAVGHIGKMRFIGAIEPWHGNQVVVYTEKSGKWQRNVIDTGLVDGHTLWTGDFNGDGRDEIVAGYRGKGHQVLLYSCTDKQAKHWTRTVVDDGGMGAAACAIADLNGDGRPDIACIGSATANLKWYENLGWK
ncbi:MAG: FG-GAP repeat domain-containing protein [Bryobacteraceae bacterium]